MCCPELFSSGCMAPVPSSSSTAFLETSLSRPPPSLQFVDWLGLSHRESTPITGHRWAGREKDCRGSNCSFLKWTGSWLSGRERGRGQGGRGKESPGVCDGTKIEGLGLLWAKLLPSTCSQGDSGSGEPTRSCAGCRVIPPGGSAGCPQAALLQWLEQSSE